MGKQTNALLNGKSHKHAVFYINPRWMPLFFITHIFLTIKPYFYISSFIKFPVLYFIIDPNAVVPKLLWTIPLSPHTEKAP